MWGTIINTAAVVAGGLLGLCLKKGIPENISNTIVNGLAIGIGLLGVSMGLETNNIIIPFVCIALGAVIGELIGIEKGIIKAGEKLEAAVSKNKSSTFVQGFVTATLLYCTGSMAILGSITDGLTGDITILATKALLDGIFSIILTSTLGLGAIFAALPVFVYQGSITLLAGLLEPILTETVIAEMTSVGGILIIGIALGQLEIKHIALGNLLPAVFLPIPLMYGIQWVQTLF